MFLVRIFTVDFYMNAPLSGLDVLYSEFRGAPVHNVPVIRIFGSTEQGVKTCLHIHGAFPYIYIPFEGSENANTVMHQIAAKLDQALNTSFGQGSSSAKHVYKVSLVSGIPFYGYHTREHQFLKIYFYNPLVMKKASSLLQNGNILGKVYQLHEAHIPFVLQFMIDYNLHGMNYISLSEVHYRANPEDPLSDIPTELILSSNITRTSTSKLEVDGLVENIVNRFELMMGNIAKNPGIAALWEDEKQRRRNKNQDSQISPCLSQTRTDIPPTNTHMLYRDALRARLILTNDSNEVDKVDQFNCSVYPAEVPRYKKMTSASLVENHFSSSSCNTSSVDDSDISNRALDAFNNTLNVSLDDTITEDLRQVLNDLGNNIDVDDDCILTQLSKAPEEGEDNDDENVIDMSLPIAAMNTPIKIVDNGYLTSNNVSENVQEMDSNIMTTQNSGVDKRNLPNGFCSNAATDLNAVGPLQEREENARAVEGQYNIQIKSEVSSISNQTHIENVRICSNTNKASTSAFEVVDVAKRKLNFDTAPHSPQDIFLDGDDIIETNNRLLKKCKSEEFLDINMETNISQDDSTLLQTKSNHNFLSQDIPSIKSNGTLRREVVQVPVLRSSIINSKENILSELKDNTPTVVCKENNLGRCSVDLNSTTQPVHRKKLIENLTLFESSTFSSSQDLFTQLDKRVLVPKFNPPSRESIENSLTEYNIPQTVYVRPFYSDCNDITGEVQIGHTILNIGGATSNILEFQSFLTNDGLTSYKKSYIDNINCDIKHKNIKSSFCTNNKCIIATAKFPPTRKQTLSWIAQENNKLEIQQLTPRFERPKLRAFNSPGANSEDEDSISISPLTLSNEAKTSSDSTPQTPKSSRKLTTNRRASSGKKRVNRSLLDKSKNKTSATMRKSLLQSQFLHHLSPSDKLGDSLNITEASRDNTHGFLMSLENLQKAKSVLENQHLTTLIMEAHVQTRNDFKPNPECDEIKALFYMLNNDTPVEGSSRIGIIVNSSIPHIGSMGVNCDVSYVDSEVTLITTFVELVKVNDPDILAGYEVELLSWGYLLERGTALNINLQSLLSRTQVRLNFLEDEFNSGLKLAGRVILDVWRLMRHEIALQSYTFENVMYHILHKRVPLYSFKELISWWENGSCRTVFNFYVCRVKGISELLDQLDIIGRTSELARLFGIQFYEVLSRGSQFRVESMMLRLAKPLNYVAVSPSVQQKVKMKAPEFISLILEPESRFYTDPVIVLDFQSLYPSIMIAYNYCFSTCLGKVEHLGKSAPFTFGATQLRISRTKLKYLYKRNMLNFSPCGAVFVNSRVREGILGRMLTEILEARLMVKESMKQNKDNKVLQRVLHSRQLGLKLIANVTYGYTAANFSGRMPLVELGDSVVSKGRETLLRAIKLIENTPTWDAKVVYGDTDSIFVLVPGRTRQSAFKIGAEIASAVTNDNPSPIKLKLEKVFHPCILQTKKRYVGYMYESPDDIKPEFCAKGIETVRRDGCPAVSKMLEKSLKILFDTCDVSLVRKYVVRQFSKLLAGQISIQDLTFAKEYRGMTSYRPGACVPALELAKKWMAVDKRSEPRRGERVPYLIVNGPPGLPLIKLVRSPREVLSDSSLIPNVLYYITRVIIPPLNRVFLLIGADLNTWFNNMPRKQMRLYTIGTPDSSSKKRAISHYFSTTSCLVCSQQTPHGLCTNCCNSPQHTVVFLHNKIKLWEQCQSELTKICQSCCNHLEHTQCISLDCPVLYRLKRAEQDLQQASYVREMVTKNFSF